MKTASCLTKFVFAIFLVVVIIIFSLYLSRFFVCSGVATLVVENNSTEDIETIYVKAGDVIVKSAGISSGERSIFTFCKCGESNYEINATLASGRRMDIEDGYITCSAKTSDVLYINDNGVLLKSQSVHTSYSR